MKYIAKEGIKFVLAALFFSAVFLFFYVYSTVPLLKYLFLALFFLFFLFFVFNIYFFRDPERKPDSILSADEIVSPADGRIIFLQEVADERFLNGEALKISIFMSLFNVHINRIPVSGRVEKIIYNKGKFFSANLDKASSENEFNGVILTLSGTGGRKSEKIAFVQIAGLIARRIVCKIKEGDEVGTGNRYGLIKFGSRLDVYLPLSFKPNVKLKDKVYSGKTVLGKIA